MNEEIRIRIRIRIYLLACRNLLWDILRLPSSRRVALGLYEYVILTLGRGANQPPYALLHMELAALRTAPRRRRDRGEEEDVEEEEEEEEEDFEVSS